MVDPEHGVGGLVAEAKSLEWALSFVADASPWSVEQAMTQLLAHENAEGFGPSLTDMVQADAQVIGALGQRRTSTAVVALRGFAAMSTIDTQRELARAHADRLVAQGLPDPPWAATIGRVRTEGCWWSHDPFDETAVVLCSFSYDGTDEPPHCQRGDTIHPDTPGRPWERPVVGNEDHRPGFRRAVRSPSSGDD